VKARLSGLPSDIIEMATDPSTFAAAFPDLSDRRDELNHVCDTQKANGAADRGRAVRTLAP